MLNRSGLKFLSVLATLTAVLLPGTTAAQSAPTTTCAYDAASGRPNPLGMRAFVTATEQDGNTIFRFEQFPSPVGGEGQVTIASRRELTFYGTRLPDARNRMLQDPSYYAELVGSPDDQGFAAVNEVLVCRVASSNPSAPTLASLPDGVYRYWSGQASSGAVLTDEDLLNRGGALFLFRKTGNQVVGAFSHIDDEAICVSGQLNGNTIAGIAVPYSGSISNTGESFTPWGPSGLLQVRRGQRTGTQGYYRSALLNLSSFSRINAGRRLPPSRCLPLS